MDVNNAIEIIINTCKKCNKDIKEIYYTDKIIEVKFNKGNNLTIFYKFMIDEDIEELVTEACTFKGLTK